MYSTIIEKPGVSGVVIFECGEPEIKEFAEEVEPVKIVGISSGATKTRKHEYALGSKTDKKFNTNGLLWTDFLNDRYDLDLKPGQRTMSPLREESDNPTSFQANEDGTWHDFGASDEESAHGDVYSFIKIKENCGFTEAYEIFNDRKPSGAVEIDESVNNVKEDMALVVEYCSVCLHRSPDVLKYLDDRGLTDEIIRNQKIGYLDSMSSLEHFLDSKGRTLEDSELYLGNFLNRIVIPYLNRRGEPEYLIARKITPAAGEAKYVKLCRKGKEDLIQHPPFGMHTLARRGFRRIILGEGVLDAVTLMQLGEVVLASCGGQFSREQEKDVIGILRTQMADNPDLEVVIWMDYDPESETGQKATMELAERLLKNGIQSKIVLPSDEMIRAGEKVDVNSLFVEKGNGKVADVIKEAKSYIDHRLKSITSITNSLKRYEAAVGFAKTLRKSGNSEVQLKIILEQNGFISKDANTIAKSSSPTPQAIAEEIAESGKYLFSNCLYVNEGPKGFRTPDAMETDTLLRRKLEEGYGHGNITSKMVNESKDALFAKANIGSDVHACRVEFGTRGWVEKTPIMDPVLRFPNCAVVLKDSGPEIIRDSSVIFSKLSFDYNYDPDAMPTVFLDALKTYLPEEIHKLMVQEAAGYLFFPDHVRQQHFFVFIGNGGNGKGTVVRAFQAFMGQRLCASFTLNKFKETHSLSSLVGKRLITISEIDRHEDTNVGAIKTWTGGDAVDINPKYENSFNYLPEGKLLISTNVRPYLPDPSDGIFRRILPLEFRHTIVRPDGCIESEIAKEKAGLMNWAIEGYYSFLNNGSWADRLPEDCKSLREEICQGGDPFRQWAATRLIRKSGGRCAVDHAFRDYRQWAFDSNIRMTMNMHSFSIRLRQHTGGSEPSHGRLRAYTGWELAPMV